MEQLEIFTIPNPCCGICESNRKGYCKGCLRTRDERLHWLEMTNPQKQYVLHLCILRRKKLQLLAWQQRQNNHSIVLPEQMDFDF